MIDDLIDAMVGWLFAAVAAASAVVGAVVTEPAAPAPVPAVELVEVPSVAEGLGTLGYTRCDAPTGPGPCFWDGVGGPYVVDTLGGVIPLLEEQRPP